MRSVFEGGVGWIKAGMDERSIESCGVRRPFFEGVDEGERGGESCDMAILFGSVFYFR